MPFRLTPCFLLETLEIFGPPAADFYIMGILFVAWREILNVNQCYIYLKLTLLC